MNTYPTVNLIDFHMNSYPASIYSEIETFCNENEFTVDYFLSEFAQKEDQLQRPFRAWRGRGALSESWTNPQTVTQNPHGGFFMLIIRR